MDDNWWAGILMILLGAMLLFQVLFAVAQAREEDKPLSMGGRIYGNSSAVQRGY